ncbi:MAG TPA: VCBS repeat-containing protein, partial [Pyrinomonadaceae bacterium]|nr:VCBS repeat-containing protein [Pyrinomonadaceae bacterium]
MPRNKRLISTAVLFLCLFVWACLSGAGTEPACARAGCESANFAPTVVFPVGDHPADIAAADFNGDGNTDLVTANNNSSNVSVLLGDGAGGFTGPANFAAGLGTNSVGVGDFNG